MRNIKEYIENLQSTISVHTRQRLLLGLIVIAVFLGLVIIIKLLTSTNSNRSTKRNKQQGQSSISSAGEETMPRLELATQSIEGADKWQSFLEDAIENETLRREEKIKDLEEALNTTETALKESQDKELEEIKLRLAFTLNELEKVKADNIEIRDDMAMANSGMLDDRVMPIDLSINTILEDDELSAPKSNWNHIPATSYVTGHLLGGISVSTSINSASEPIPVVIRLTSRGNLPKEFAVDITSCRLLASSYGDISSERAIVRAEELICEDKDSGLITSTKVAGVIYGDDGMNGIKGSVVSMSGKHLKSAFVGGLLSGFSNTVKGSGGISITPMGAMNTAKKRMYVVLF